MSTPLPPPIYEYEVCFRDGSNLFIMTDHAIFIMTGHAITMYNEDLPKWMIVSLMDAKASWNNAKKAIIRTKDIRYIVLHRVFSPGEGMEAKEQETPMQRALRLSRENAEYGSFGRKDE